MSKKDSRFKSEEQDDENNTSEFELNEVRNPATGVFRSDFIRNYERHIENLKKKGKKHTAEAMEKGIENLKNMEERIKDLTRQLNSSMEEDTETKE